MRTIKMEKYGNRLVSEEIEEDGKIYVYEIGFHYVENKFYLDEEITILHPGRPSDSWAKIIKYADSIDELVKEIEERRNVNIVIEE